MNKLEWTELCLKIFSLFLLYKFLSEIPNTINILFLPDKFGGKWILPGTFGGLFILLILAIIVWWLSPFISRIIWKASVTSESLSSPTIDEIQAAVFSAIGLYILINSLPHFIQFFILINQEGSPYQTQKELSLKVKGEIIIFCFKFILGLWLLISSKGLVNLIKKVRNLGLEKNG
jgi:hypothetical protein